ncbi:hypothetical protein AUEXF2481DRAFT_303402 [Aureobasidium subglaciale EXF-2481]|uniref:Uncharacterized protein n=1 Tax=Aureobasidium subglaciale (strain EXF-2481) TaxID=1043005 RepID=A0A074Z426_AURSE|nr:uncharacterized protein AUEXF2481DRAFT_303402 [Aureobasidium subglaciale EXF-2481]KEQ93756.1 hypothetical protein AUEXF2481DRAFT_303402 [Aureobasidium subglaciale EXF-2481]
MMRHRMFPAALPEEPSLMPLLLWKLILDSITIVLRIICIRRCMETGSLSFQESNKAFQFSLSVIVSMLVLQELSKSHDSVPQQVGVNMHTESEVEIHVNS